jgi:hypothetical protein
MSEATSYADLIVSDPDERLAWLAHSVCTPFTDLHRYSDNLESKIYALVARDIGEQLAASTVLHDMPVLKGEDILRELQAVAKDRTDPHSQRFLDDELAIAHAAMVYTVCVSDFESCIVDLEA